MTRTSQRHARRARRFAATVLACLLSAGCREKPPTQPDVATSLAAIVATCAAVVGDVEVKRAGRETWTRVTTGAVLRVGDTIRTLPGAFARVEFLSGNGIELEESTTAVVDLTSQVVAAAAAPSAAAERVAVQGGVARGFFAEKPGIERGPIAIRAPDGKEARLAPAAGAADVRFRLTATATGTEIAITSGSASVVGPAGEVALGPGSAVELASEGLGPPVELIALPESLRPSVDARVQLAPGLAIALTWARVESAGGYRVQIARDLSFREVVLAREVEDRSLTFEPVEEGMYAWRVAARDRAGRYGEYGFARRLYCDAGQRRELLSAPADGAVVRAPAGAPIRFAWQGAAGARGYRLVVASRPDLTEREVRSATTRTASVDVPGLAPGVYYWSVYVDDERREPIFVKPRRLVVVEKAPPPKVRVPSAIRERGS